VKGEEAMMEFSNSQWRNSGSRQHANAIRGAAASTLYIHHQDPTIDQPSMVDMLSERTQAVISETGSKFNKWIIGLLALIWSSGILLAAVLIGLSSVF